MTIKRAVILVAGESKRMYPLTERTHKCMLYIKGKPLLSYILDIVTSAGINEIVLIIGHGGENIRNYMDTYYKKLNVKFVIQEKRQGTAHAIQQAEKYISDDFLVLNGDVLLNRNY